MKMKDSFNGDKAKKISLTPKILAPIVTILVILVLVLYSGGKSDKINSLITQNLDSKINETEEKITELKSDVEALNGEIDILDKELDSKKELYDAYIDYNTKKIEYNNEIKANNDKNNSLLTSIEEKQIELQRLSTGVVATGEPITLGAGEHTVGTSLPAGRYKITGSSNLFIYSADGDLLVNTILGGGWGVSSYTVNLGDGYRIEAHGKDTFLPVE